MKKVAIFLGFVAMLCTGSCTSFSHKMEMQSDVDTLSYYYGLTRAEGIMNYLTMQAGVDTAYMDAFYKGFKDGAKNYSPKDVAYLEGMRIAQMINNQWVTNLNYDLFMGDSGQTVNRHAMLSGFYNGVKNPDERRIMQTQSFVYMKIETVKDSYKKQKYAEIIAASEQFLVDNKSKPGVITTASGLQYKIITEGSGAIPSDRSKVKVNYRGVLVDGTEFDSSYANDVPSTFTVNQLVIGWKEALLLMPVGSKWELYIPYNLGYGSAGQLPKIPPYVTLIFEVELVEIEAN